MAASSGEDETSTEPTTAGAATLVIPFTGYWMLLLWGAFCAAQDARYQRISNKLTLPAIAIAAIFLTVFQHSFTLASVPAALTALLLALLFSLPGYISNRFGAGDVKMLCALALATDPLFFLVTIGAAAITVVLWLLITALRPHSATLAQSSQRSALPYAPLLFSGMLTASLLRLFGVLD